MVSIGKVRTEMIKRISNELIDRYEKSFTVDFEQNKQFLKEIGLDVSKKLRNKVAGYVTTLMKIELAPFDDEEELEQPQILE